MSRPLRNSLVAIMLALLLTGGALSQQLRRRNSDAEPVRVRIAETGPGRFTVSTTVFNSTENALPLFIQPVLYGCCYEELTPITVCVLAGHKVSYHVDFTVATRPIGNVHVIVYVYYEPHEQDWRLYGIGDDALYLNY